MFLFCTNGGFNINHLHNVKMRDPHSPWTTHFWQKSKAHRAESVPQQEMGAVRFHGHHSTITSHRDRWQLLRDSWGDSQRRAGCWNKLPLLLVWTPHIPLTSSLLYSSKLYSPSVFTPAGLSGLSNSNQTSIPKGSKPLEIRVISDHGGCPFS